MDKELLEQFQMLADGMAKMEERIKSELRDEIRQSEARSKIYIDDKVTKRLDSLTDGYKSVHEKQWELEHRMERLERVISDLQSRIA